MTRLTSLLALLFCLTALLKTSAAPNTGDPADFEARYAAAEELSLDGKWKDARAAWLAALRDHAGASYVNPKLPEVREALRRAAFWTVQNRPKPQTLVSGKLTSFSRSTGKIRLQYELDQLGDFKTLANFKLHPLHFRGTYTVEIEADPQALVNQSFLVGMAGDSGYSIRIGDNLEGAPFLYYHQLSRIEGANNESLQQVEPKQRKSKTKGKSVKIKITVSKSTVTVTYNGRKILSGKKSSDELGQIGFTLPVAFEKLVISGIAEIAWLDDLVDASVQEDRRAFDATYTHPPELDAWGDSTAPPKRRSRDLAELTARIPLPDRFTPGQLELVNEVTALIRAREHDQANALLESLAEKDFPEASRLFLLLFNNQGAKRYLSALTYADKLIDEHKASPELQHVAVILRLNVEQYKQAITQLEALLIKTPEDLALCVELATTLMLEGRLDDARARIDRGLAISPFDEELVELRDQVAKASQGPSWKRSFDQEGDDFLVRSDISDRMTRIVSNTVEDAWKHYSERFGAVPAGAEKLKLYLFSGASSYESYIEGVASKSPENTAGLYSTRLKQLLIWNQPDREQLMDVVRHETMHAYMDATLGQSPTWFGEGVAEYFAAAKLKDKSWEEGADAKHHLLFFGQAKLELLTVEQLLYLDHPNFMLNAQYCYPMSWAFIDFLLHSTPENHALFEATWKALESDTDSGTATHHVFDSVDLGALNKAFWKDLKSKL